MDDKQKNKLLIAFGLTIGILLGILFHDGISSIFRAIPTEEIQFCPSGQEALPHFADKPIWDNNGLLWTITPVVGTIPQQIDFFEADVVGANDELSCFYRSPSDNNQILKMTLNTPMKTKLALSGENWKSIMVGMSCKDSDVTACGFKLNKKPAAL